MHGSHPYTPQKRNKNSSILPYILKKNKGIELSSL